MEGSGVFTWRDGRRYEGEYTNDKKNGYGEFTWPNGKVYKGMWRDGKQDGEGTLINSKTGDSTKASWLEGKRIAGDESNKGRN